LVENRDFFYRARRMHSADCAVARCLCPSVRPSVRPSVCLSHAGIVSKRRRMQGGIKIAILDQYLALSRKRYKIEPKANRKPYTSFRMVGLPV